MYIKSGHIVVASYNYNQPTNHWCFLKKKRRIKDDFVLYEGCMWLSHYRLLQYFYDSPLTVILQTHCIF